jgi:hypothetical protein
MNTQTIFVQEREAYVLMRGFLEQDPSNLLMITERFGGSIGLGALYDHRVTSYNDPAIAEFGEVLTGKLDLLQPGASFYDMAGRLADWIPYALMPSKKTALRVRERSEAIDTKMSKIVQERMFNNDGTSSFHAGLLEREKQGSKEFTVFERDTLTGSLAGAAVDVRLFRCPRTHTTR